MPGGAVAFLADVLGQEANVGEDGVEGVGFGREG